jgi:DNA-binding transcriptional LysR family regulator
MDGVKRRRQGGRTLRLGGPAELTTTRVLPTLVDTVAAGVVVRCRLGLADDLLAELVAGQLDLVISTVRPRRRSLHSEPLCDEEFLLLAAPSLVARLDADLLIAIGLDIGVIECCEKFVGNVVNCFAIP